MVMKAAEAPPEARLRGAAAGFVGSFQPNPAPSGGTTAAMILRGSNSSVPIFGHRFVVWCPCRRAKPNISIVSSSYSTALSILVRSHPEFIV